MPRTPIASCNTQSVSHCIPRAKESQLEWPGRGNSGVRERGASIGDRGTDVVRGNLGAEEVVLLDHVGERQGTEGWRGVVFVSGWRSRGRDCGGCLGEQKPKTSQVVELRPGNSRNFASSTPKTQAKQRNRALADYLSRPGFGGTNAQVQTSPRQPRQGCVIAHHVESETVEPTSPNS